MAKIIDIKNISLSDNDKPNSLKISIKDNDKFKDTVKLFRELIKQDDILNEKLAVKTTRSDIKTFTIKFKGDIPAGFDSLRDLVEQLLTNYLNESFSVASTENLQPQHIDSLQEKTSAHSSRQSHPSSFIDGEDDDDDDDDDTDAEMPKQFKADPDPIDFDPYDFGNEDSVLMGISGEDVCFSASHERFDAGSHGYEEDDDLGYCLDFS